MRDDTGRTQLRLPAACFRFVDLYTLNTQNMSTKYLNTTFHHSRLMGASDIYNSVSHSRYLLMVA